MQLTFETVCVHQILQRAYEICLEEINAKRQEVEFSLRAESSFVSGDPARLQQIFWNLIKNSVKFTPEGGRIRIDTVNPSAETIEIAITDTGIGIEKEKLGRVFNAFEQGQSSITRRFGGLGLGLAISKAMVKAHDGAHPCSERRQRPGLHVHDTLKNVTAPALKPTRKRHRKNRRPRKSENGEHPPRASSWWTITATPAWE